FLQYEGLTTPTSLSEYVTLHSNDELPQTHFRQILKRPRAMRQRA
ncbi:MAG: hypothetical protein RJB09_863, partial [Pseudomonadota bacterium]